MTGRDTVKAAAKRAVREARKRRRVKAASIHLDAQCIVCGEWYKLSGPAHSSGRRTCSDTCKRIRTPSESTEAKRARDRKRYATQGYRDKERERNKRRAEYKAAYAVAHKDLQAQRDKERRKARRDERIREYLDSPSSHCLDCAKPQPWERRNHIRCEACELTHNRAVSNAFVKAKYHSDPETRTRMIGHAHARRARQLNTQTEPINPMIVFNRDAWKCQRLGCGKTTRIDVSRYASNRAVLGHINALAAGGTHTYDNVCCLCHPCNVADGVNKATIQRSLIA